MMWLTIAAICLSFLAGWACSSAYCSYQQLAERRRELRHLQAESERLAIAEAASEARMQEWQATRKEGGRP